MPDFDIPLDTRGRIRIEALKDGRLQWGHHGYHHGSGAPGCPRDRLHHHHDAFCALPTPMELVIAGVEKPKEGWHSRA